MRIAISGMRDIVPADYPIIEGEIADILSEHPEEILFGGARGTDTVALAAACATLGGTRPPKLTVIVPKRVKDQPLEAQEWISECADEVMELKAPRLDTKAYWHRNRALIARSDGLVAFWDGHSGGTGMTIRLAEDMGKPVHVAYLSGSPYSLGNGTKRYPPLSVHEHPWRHWVFSATPSVEMPVTTLGFYMAAFEGLDRLSQFIRATKAETVSPLETKYWGDVAAAVIASRPELREAAMIIPVPRRAPGRPNDLAALVARTCSETGMLDGTNLLLRAEEPIGGEEKAGRIRFPSREHGRTIVVDPEHRIANRITTGTKVILLDNVLTLGGTLEGARQALMRDLPGVEPVGFAMLVSGDYAIS